MTTTPLYAAIAAILMIILLFNVIRFRLGFKVAIGDGNFPELKTAIRVHGNFVETVPMALIVLYMYETMTIPAEWMPHALGVLLIISRISHAYGLSTKPESTSIFRFFGMIGTLLAILIPAIMIFVYYVNALNPAWSF